MERALVNLDLKKIEYQPKHLIDEYKKLLIEDIINFDFIKKSKLRNFSPFPDDEFEYSFKKMGLSYNFSNKLKNIFLSQRPKHSVLKSFYLNSRARKFWLTDLLQVTKKTRDNKIIIPHLKWAQRFTDEYLPNKQLSIVEYLANNWSYLIKCNEIFEDNNYSMIDELFDYDISHEGREAFQLLSHKKLKKYDVAFLFEAIDRSVDPFDLLTKVRKALTSNGLCFITCLFSSGYEIQTLGSSSDIFVPPERMNIFSLEGMKCLIEKVGGFEILELSTPGEMDVQNSIMNSQSKDYFSFFNYLKKVRNDHKILHSFQQFLQLNCLASFGRIVLKKTS